MIDYVKQILTAQNEASLSMLKMRIEVCPEEAWDGMIGQSTFGQDAYHVLFWFDYYLTPHEDMFVLRDLHHQGGDEREPVISKGLNKHDTLGYVERCHEKLLTSIAAETEMSLQGNSGFPSVFRKRPITRGELYLYNMRHLQHHTAQLSNYLRRYSDANGLSLKLPWVGTGWR